MRGSVYQRGKTWSYIIDIGINPKTGRRKQKGKGGFKKQKDAQKALTAMLNELNEGTYVEEKKITFEELAASWLKRYSNHGKPKKEGTIRVRTHEMNCLLPQLGKLIVSTITESKYQDALNNLKNGEKDKFGEVLKKGLSPNTLSGVNSTGNMIFDYGIKVGATKNNPAKTAYVPKDIKTVEELENSNELPKYLEKDELIHFLNTAQSQGLDNDYEKFITLAYTGMRVGELCALKFADIDFENNKIRVIRTLYNPNNNYRKYKLNTPKTSSSIREVDVEPFIIDNFKNLMSIQGIEKNKRPNTYHDEGFIFAKTGLYAGYPEVVKMVELRMKRLLKLSGLNQELTPHSLRHTHTSLLAEAGVSLEQIMQRLGHSDDDITKRIYLHITKPKRKEASQKFAELLDASKK